MRNWVKSTGQSILQDKDFESGWTEDKNLLFDLSKSTYQYGRKRRKMSAWITKAMLKQVQARDTVWKVQKISEWNQFQ